MRDEVAQYFYKQLTMPRVKRNQNDDSSSSPHDLKTAVKTALFIGRPNVGKSTVFNTLLQKRISETGNWDGVTVGERRGTRDGITFVDLPGIDEYIVDDVSLGNVIHSNVAQFCWSDCSFSEVMRQDKDIDDHIVRAAPDAIASSSYDNELGDVASMLHSANQQPLGRDAFSISNHDDSISDDQFCTINTLRKGKYDLIIHIGEAQNILGTIILSMQLSTINARQILVLSEEYFRKRSKLPCFLQSSFDIEKLENMLQVKIILARNNAEAADSIMKYCQSIQGEGKDTARLTQAASDHTGQYKYSFDRSMLLNLAIRIYDSVQIGPKLRSAYVNDLHDMSESSAQSNITHGSVKRTECESDDDLNSKEAPGGSSSRFSNWYCKSRENAEEISEEYCANYSIAKRLLNWVVRDKKDMTKDMNSNANIAGWIDDLLLNRFWGFAAFAVVTYLLFLFTVLASSICEPAVAFLVRDIVINNVCKLLAYFGVSSNMIFDGAGLGIQMVMSFAPTIFFLYLAMIFLEESGYMTRASILTNGIMKKLGLPGRASMSLILGMGCNVNSVLSARTIANKKQRIAVILISPFITCGARFSIFVVLCSAFYPERSAVVIFFLYVIGIAVALLFAWGLKIIMKLEVDNSFVIVKMPEYRLPKLSTMIYRAWRRVMAFIKNGFKIIVPVAMLFHIAVENQSIDGLKSCGKALSHVTQFMGVKRDNWEASIGLVAGIISKEMILGTTGSLYLLQKKQDNMQDDMQDDNVKSDAHTKDIERHDDIYVSGALHNSDELGSKMKAGFSSDIASFAYLVFILLYFPCISVFAVIKNEIGLKYSVISAVFSTVFAYFVSVLIYQVGSVYNIYH